MTQDKLKTWFENNSWNLLVTGIGIIMSFTVLNMRVNAIEKKVDQYPSYDYFELRFSTLEKQLNVVSGKIDTHMATK